MAMKGKDKHLNRLRRLSGPDVIKLAGRVVFVGADMVRAEAFRGVSAGSVSGNNHVPSSPGEFPNRDSGGLQNGFKTEQTGPTSAEFRSETEYSTALEFGTSKMKARPHVRPARDAAEPKIQRLFADGMNKLVRSSGK
jgi:HK97 gp10 family phage protein